MLLTADVEFIISRLSENGHRADVVGGPVRDWLRGVAPSDYDITTSATPEEIKAAFSNCRTIDTGIKHGTVTLILNKVPYEITTYRIDGDYLDSRHPETVSFTQNIAEDLARRDFTVNAIAYNPKFGITDPFGGREDIEKKIIRAVGDPHRRFSEDALRILRALRFSATLGFGIEVKTAEALREKSCLLLNISAERIYTEWKKLLSGDFAYSVIRDFSEVISVFIPELRELKLPEEKDFAADFITRQAQLFYLTLGDGSAYAADAALRRLKTDSLTRDVTVKMLENVGKYRLSNLFDAGKMLIDLDVNVAEALVGLEISLGNFAAQSKELLKEYIASGLPYKTCQLAIDGNDIKALGISGKEIGKMLFSLLSLVASGELENKKETLIECIKHQKM